MNCSSFNSPCSTSYIHDSSWLAWSMAARVMGNLVSVRFSNLDDQNTWLTSTLSSLSSLRNRSKNSFMPCCHNSRCIAELDLITSNPAMQGSFSNPLSASSDEWVINSPEGKARRSNRSSIKSIRMTSALSSTSAAPSSALEKSLATMRRRKSEVIRSNAASF
ncbi:hypothetical protein D3C71_1649830 [compost metagenome]